MATKNLQTLKNRLEHVKGLMLKAPREDRIKLREIVDLIKDEIKRAEKEQVNEMTASGGVASFTTSGPKIGTTNRYMVNLGDMMTPRKRKRKPAQK